MKDFKDLGFHCGVDEVGRGAWSGPVVAAAVRFDKNHNITGLADSKTLSPRQRIKLYFDGNILPESYRSASRAYSIVKGDNKIASIAAASIVAKVSRDFHMKSLNIRFPGYGWEKNVGYGVEQHKAAINKLGVNTEHRRSFRPIYNMLCL